VVKRIFPGCCLFFIVSALPCWAQITSTNFAPLQAAQGSSFTLVINGKGFSGATVVQFVPGTGISVSGAPAVTPTQVTAQVQIAANAPTIPHRINVISGGQFGTAPGFFTVTAAVKPPTLTRVGPVLVSQGSQNIRLTLTGTNFRPGAKVVISPPLARVTDSNAGQPASDLVVQSVVRVSDTLLLAEITVGQRAAPGLRAVDVVNADGTSTGKTAVGGTSQPLNIAASNSLAAPLNVATIEMTYPRNGTVLSQGDDIFGAAVLAGTGTGMVTGEWVWDGNPIEQFSVPMSGGSSVRLKTMRALPSTYLGPHTLSVRVNSPNQLQTRSVDLVINPGNWKLEKLLAPASDAGFSANSLPMLQWALIPGADHYQVGFATQPFYGSVERWHDTTATEWRVPENIWKQWPEGQLYWTVRVVDISGDTRRPAPMRSLWKLPATAALQPLAAAQDETGMAFSWQGVQGKVLYRISISRNPDGTQVIQQFLTRSAKFHLGNKRLRRFPAPAILSSEVLYRVLLRLAHRRPPQEAGANLIRLPLWDRCQVRRTWPARFRAGFRRRRRRFTIRSPASRLSSRPRSILRM